MEKVKKFFRKRCGKIYGILQSQYSELRDKKFQEIQKRFGKKNPERVFYVIRNKDYKTGLMSYYNSVLGHILYAKEHSYSPVIDMCNYRNTYLEQKDIGHENSWEYYFCQPGNLELKEVYQSRNVILSDGSATHLASPRVLYEQYYRDPFKAEELFEIIGNVIPLKKEVQQTIEQQYRKIFPEDARVLGVVCRGTDLLNFSCHSRQPSVRELIAIAEEKMEAWNCPYLFLASDTDAAVKEFRAYFGEHVLTNTCQRYDRWKERSGGSDSLGDVRFSRERDAYLRGLEYLTTLMLLSRCNCLTGTLIGSTVGAIGFNMGKFEEIEIIDRGIYE